MQNISTGSCWQSYWPRGDCSWWAAPAEGRRVLSRLHLVLWMGAVTGVSWCLRCSHHCNTQLSVTRWPPVEPGSVTTPGLALDTGYPQLPPACPAAYTPAWKPGDVGLIGCSHPSSCPSIHIVAEDRSRQAVFSAWPVPVLEEIIFKCVKIDLIWQNYGRPAARLEHFGATVMFEQEISFLWPLSQTEPGAPSYKQRLIGDK